MKICNQTSQAQQRPNTGYSRICFKFDWQQFSQFNLTQTDCFWNIWCVQGEASKTMWNDFVHKYYTVQILINSHFRNYEILLTLTNKFCNVSVVVKLLFHNCFISGEEAIERDEIKRCNRDKTCVHHCLITLPPTHI